LQPKGNLLVIFEEVGGDPLQISVVTRSQDVICGHVSELHPPPFDETWISNHNTTSTTPTLQLACTAGHHIIDINFSSYGNPDGSCGDFRKGACHAVDSFAAVHKVRTSGPIWLCWLVLMCKLFFFVFLLIQFDPPFSFMLFALACNVGSNFNVWNKAIVQRAEA
jgi:hypothetical protein